MGAQALIKEGRSKEAKAKLQDLAEAVPGNARTYHLLGMAQLELGEYSAARSSLERANAFDCGTGRASVVSNAIMRSIAAKNALPILDFAKDVEMQVGMNTMFLGDATPQAFAYQQLADKIRRVVARHFHLLKSTEGAKP